MDRVFGLLYEFDFDIIEINFHSLLSADILRIYKFRVYLWISYFFDDITTFLGP